MCREYHPIQRPKLYEFYSVDLMVTLCINIYCFVIPISFAPFPSSFFDFCNGRWKWFTRYYNHGHVIIVKRPPSVNCCSDGELATGEVVAGVKGTVNGVGSVPKNPPTSARTIIRPLSSQSSLHTTSPLVIIIALPLGHPRTACCGRRHVTPLTGRDKVDPEAVRKRGRRVYYNVIVVVRARYKRVLLK